MQTHFVTLEVELETAPDRLQQAILLELQKRGEPLRWAIVSVDNDRSKAIVEAVVTTAAEFLIPGSITTV